MKLSTEDGQLYYKLWLPLLDYVNDKKGINKNLQQMVHAKQLIPNEVKEIADIMWDEVDIIDEYLKDCGEHLQVEEREIVRGWKRRVRGQFLLERHLKKGSILISMEDGRVYQVSGIISSWEEMFRYAPMPIVMEATLIPFKDVIISDGLVLPYNVVIGSHMKADFKDSYLAAKSQGLIRRSL